MSRIAQAEVKMLTNRSFAPLSIAATRPLALTGVLAGLAGGLAEVVWIGLYSGASGTSGFDVARRVADTVFPGVLQMPAGPALGLAIHFGLSAVLGLLLVRPLTSAILQRSGALLPICLGILGLIWSVNFMLVLPILNPIFSALLPAWVTLTSKLLFGAALAGVLGQRSANAA
ncbi:MAG TPA: hypothetical protein VKA03_09865 [Methylovirgula sp.]|nr:hypothetical protein [Methylovirgula sp.]